jgi:hypothetical protein
MHDFPTHPDELTAAWLTMALRKGGAIGEGQEVASFSSSTIGEGISLLGLVQRVELTYSDGGGSAGPASVVIKFAHPLEANRAIAMNTNMYWREIDFFRNIAPHVEMPLTACYHADIDLATGDNAVVLEDLRAYRAGDQVAGVSAAEAKQIIDAYAPLNAAFWGKTDQPLLADTMRIDTTYMETLPPGVFGTWERCRELFPHCMTEDVLASLPRYIDALLDLHKLMGARTQTLIHGDVRLDNVMFGQGDGQHPIVLIDWQAIMISNPMQDLAYLLSQSVDTEIRRAHEDELVAYYRDKVTELGVEGYTLEQATNDYDVAVLWIMCYPLIIGGAFDPANERGLALAELVLRRSTQTVTDRNLLRLLPS